MKKIKRLHWFFRNWYQRSRWPAQKLKTGSHFFSGSYHPMVLLYKVLKLQNAVSQHWVICLTWYFHHVVFVTETIMPHGCITRMRSFLSPVFLWKFYRNQCCQLGNVSLRILQAWSFAINGYQLGFLKKTDSVRWILSVRWSKLWNHIVPGPGLHCRLVTGENC